MLSVVRGISIVLEISSKAGGPNSRAAFARRTPGAEGWNLGQNAKEVDTRADNASLAWARPDHRSARLREGSVVTMASP
jgi:hypothetical protein